MVERKILLNPGPATTTDSVKQAQIVPDICPREKEFGDLVENICKELVKISQGENNYECVLFGGSGTASMEITLSSIVPENGKASLKVFNMIGQEVAILFDRTAEAGRLYRSTFSASFLPSGLYFYRLEFGNQSIVKRMMLVK